MGVHKTVFGSSLERRCYRKLAETWASNYRVYHNLPFLNVFSGRTDLFDENLAPFKLSDIEYDRLKKTSIDFTVCDKSDAPLVCVELDGLQDGFNVGTKYRLRNGESGKLSRRSMLELKLRVAHGSMFPFFVLGSEEFRGLSDAVRLTIADGLIGEVLSQRACRQRINEGFDPNLCGYSESEFESLDPIEQNEVISNWVSEIEVQCDYELNPIVKTNANLSRELDVVGHGYTYIDDPGLDRETWVWLECDVTSMRYGKQSAKIVLPNFRTPFCGFSIHIAHEIAELLALEELRKHRKELSKI